MVKKYKAQLIISALLTSCTSQSQWAVNHIAASAGFVNTAKLKYRPSTPHSPLRFELIRMGDLVESRINLKRFHFKDSEIITVELKIGEQKIEDLARIHRGGMRISLSSELTYKVIQALQQGEEVVILVDGFEETLNAQHFNEAYEQFLANNLF